jgi:riboflavin kinase/FMN adenylyltransferase
VERFDEPLGVPDALRGGVLTIGNFDGVHRGHAALLARCRGLAGRRTVLAVTFDPHPVAVLAPSRSPACLTSVDERIRLLGSVGADAVLVLHVDREFLSQSAEAFVRDVIAPLRPTDVVEGPTFGFGAGRAGNVESLAEMGRAMGFRVHVAPPVRIELDAESPDAVVSSSLIRALLDRGDVESAARCLARPYALLGRVIRGHGAGRTMGYPTINLDCGGQLVPGDGVYAGRAIVDDADPAAAVSIGHRPTFGGAARVVEAFLLDYEGDLYGDRVRLSLTNRIRPQRAFTSPDDLSAQITRDVDAVRGLMREGAA